MNINDFPALIVCEAPLGFEDVQPTDTKFNSPSNTDFVKLEQGTIADRILDDSDALNDFLNDLYEGAKQDELEQTMNELILNQWLTIAKDKLESLILNTSMLTQ